MTFNECDVKSRSELCSMDRRMSVTSLHDRGLVIHIPSRCRSGAGCNALLIIPDTGKLASFLNLIHLVIQSSLVTPTEEARMGKSKFFFSAVFAALWWRVEPRGPFAHKK